MWKLARAESVTLSLAQFQKNLVVWKHLDRDASEATRQEFQKNLVVWKLCLIILAEKIVVGVSEELSSVETISY